MPAKRHGLSNSKEHIAWMSMRQRCNNKTNKRFRFYGGRGISVSKRWNKFESFLKDVGRAPSKHHSLDRIDNDGNYEPGNCRWAPKEVQANNTRRNIFFRFNGTMMSLKQWSNKLGFNYKRAWKRIIAGWTFDQILSDDPRRKKKTLCSKGHPFTAIKKIKNRSYQICLICRREQDKKTYRKRKLRIKNAQG